MREIMTFIKKIKMYAKTNIMFFAFVITSLINGFLVRYFTVNNPFELSPILADLSIVLIIGSFAYLFKNKGQIVYFSIMSSVIVFICIANSIYYTNFNSFTSISLLTTAIQLFGVADAVVESIMELKDFIYLWQIFAVLYLHYVLRKKNYYEEAIKQENRKHRGLNTLVVSLIIFGFFISTLTGLDVSRFQKQWNREYVVSRFGIYTYHVNDIIVSIETKFTNIFGFDEQKKLFQDFYEENPRKFEENKYTDMYKGKNILAIHAESIQALTMDLEFNGLELTPNLNRLAKEGIFFSNFYAQDATGTSSDTEFTLNTGLLPTTRGTVFVNYFNTEFQTIPKLLGEKDYYAFSMHANNGTFWNRNVAHKELGYDNFFYYDKDYVLDEIIQLGLSDKSFFRQSIPYISEIREKQENFYGTMIMLTNHTPFTDIAEKGLVDFKLDYQYEEYNEETEEYEIKSLPYLEGTKMGDYLKSVRYADEAIGELITGLDESGVLDDTVIVIYGDHDAKLKRSYYDDLYNYDFETGEKYSKEDERYVEIDSYKVDLDRRVPFIIWTKDNQQETEIKDVMGMYDVMPTLGNLFGFKPEYALGRDALGDTDPFVVFPNGNWMTNNIFYNGQKREWIQLKPDYPVSMEEIEYYNKKADKNLLVSDAIIVYDLIARTRDSIDLLEQPIRQEE